MMTYLSGVGFSIFDLRFSIGSSDWSPPQQIENQKSKIKNLAKHEVVSPRPLTHGLHFSPTSLDCRMSFPKFRSA